MWEATNNHDTSKNTQNISSIPAQQYLCKRVVSPKFGETFEITNVPNRTHVLFHPANTVDQLQGCVAVAQHFGKLRGYRAIMNSGDTFTKLMRVLNDYTTVHLTISEVY